jgi:inhibitor of KinA sporulation pathway (predicted exonuclease)|tara:strand:+ start:70 stop:483 length:414 start_codon:yes stop_codon:yes gene_type:complete
LRNLFRKIFKSTSRKEWNGNHILYWRKPLELNNFGFSVFQNKLLNEIEIVLKDSGISYETEITEHKDLEDKNRIVKMIKLTLNEKSKFWIYHNMAELDLKGKHEIYEEWGYLKPEDLIKKYLKSTKELLKLKDYGTK